jgi:hypothetical protein
VVVTGCNADCHFIVASCNHSVSTNDIIAWQNVELYEVLEIILGPSHQREYN